MGDLIAKCQRTGMDAIAITDQGVMYGIKELMDCTDKANKKVKDKIKSLEVALSGCEDAEERASLQEALVKAKESYFKPIIGVEAYVARRTLYDKNKDFKVVNPENGRERIVDSSGEHLVLLAKNKRGYENLCKLVSISWVDGFYQRARIDKNILAEHSVGIIACSACLDGEISQLIIAGELEKAEASIRWYESIFGDDYYLELQRHQRAKPGVELCVYQRLDQVHTRILAMAQQSRTMVIHHTHF